MPDKNESTVSGTIDAITGLVKAVPVYQDGLRPAVKQVGASLLTITKAINVALSPLAGIVWLAENAIAGVKDQIADRLKDVPEERIQTPEWHVAGPAVEGLKFTAHQEELRQLYVNLLATAIDCQTAPAAHPSFVEIIRQMAPDEARVVAELAKTPELPIVNLRSVGAGTGFYVLRHITLVPGANLQFPDQLPRYLEHLQRLGLIEINSESRLADEPDPYKAILSQPEFASALDSVRAKNRMPAIEKGHAGVTLFGSAFIAACVRLDTHSPSPVTPPEAKQPRTEEAEHRAGRWG